MSFKKYFWTLFCNAVKPHLLYSFWGLLLNCAFSREKNWSHYWLQFLRTLPTGQFIRQPYQASYRNWNSSQPPVSCGDSFVCFSMVSLSPHVVVPWLSCPGQCSVKDLQIFAAASEVLSSLVFCLAILATLACLKFEFCLLSSVNPLGFHLPLCILETPLAGVWDICGPYLICFSSLKDHCLCNFSISDNHSFTYSI